MIKRDFQGYTGRRRWWVLRWFGSNRAASREAVERAIEKSMLIRLTPTGTKSR